MFKFSQRTFTLVKRNMLERCRRPGLVAVIFAAVIVISGCNTIAPLPPADISAAGWTKVEGQAVWRRSLKAPELAGEILIATNRDGSAFIQFSKNPFPFVTAQLTPRSWELSIPVRDRRYSGPGKPPSRIVWFVLLNALKGKPLPAHWEYTDAENRWRLQNALSGEFVEGVFFR